MALLYRINALSQRHSVRFRAVHTTCLGTVGTLLVAVVMLSQASASPVVPGAKQTQPIALVNGTIHPITSAAIENGVLLFDQGKIVALGKNVAVPENAKQVDVAGKHVYPGLFNAGGQLGLVEINAVRATSDRRETGSINPNVRAEVAVNPDSESIPVTRSNGVLLSLTVPKGGLIAGSSAVLQLDGWTWEDLTLKSRAGIHISWPRSTPGEKENEQLRLLHKTIKQAQAYHKARKADPRRYEIDLRMQAIVRVLEREIPIVAMADAATEIRSRSRFAIDTICG